MKEIYIPGKVWDTPQKFIKEFPGTKTALGLLAYGFLDENRPLDFHQHTTPQNDRNHYMWPKNPADVWKAVYTYRAMIEYAISRANPITFNYALAAEPRIARYGCINPGFMGRTPTFTPSGCDPDGEGESGYENVYPIPGIIDEDSTEFLNTVFFDKRYTPNWKPFSDTRAVKFNELRNHISSFLSNAIDRNLSYFRATVGNKKIQLNEIYGKFKTADEVPANTIAYTIVDQPPPVDSSTLKYNYDTVQFWSAIFGSKMGRPILNGVANNMPVKIRTRVSTWQDPVALAKKIKETSKQIEIWQQWIFNDFEVEAGKDNNILIKYNRGKESQTVIFQKQSQWGLYIAIAVVSILTIGAAAYAAYAATATGAAAGAAGTTGSLTTTGALATSTAVTTGVSTSGGRSEEHTSELQSH